MNPKDTEIASERAEGPADERAAFEVWAHLNLFGLELNAAGSYEHRATRYAWQGWLARSRLAAATPVVPPSKSAMIAILEAQGWQWTPSSGEGGLYRYLPHEGVEFVQVSTLEALAASPSPRTPEQPEQPSVHPVDAPAERPAAVDDGRDTRALLTALRYYARGQHFIVQDDDFDTVSGEPQNWQSHHDEPIMFEDGTVARMALRGEPINWLDGGEDETPQPIDGEPA